LIFCNCTCCVPIAETINEVHISILLICLQCKWHSCVTKAIPAHWFGLYLSRHMTAKSAPEGMWLVWFPFGASPCLTSEVWVSSLKFYYWYAFWCY
jgi:hypothetical protein